MAMRESDLIQYLLGTRRGGSVDVNPAPTSPHWADSAVFNAKNSAKSSSDPMWMQALQGLRGVTSGVTEGLASATEPGKNFFDRVNDLLNLGDAPKHFWQAVLPTDENGKALAPKLPGAGLVAMGKENRGTSDVLNNLGWTQAAQGESSNWFRGREGNRWYAPDLFDITSFLGDVLLDPVTYATLGGTSALKIGNMAERAAVQQVAKQAGVQVGKNIYDLPKTIYDSVLNRPVQGVTDRFGVVRNEAGINADLLQRLSAKQARDTAQTSIESAGKAARQKAQNALLNIDIPFAQQAWAVGQKPGFLKVFDQKIGKVGAVAANRTLSKIGATSEKDQAKILQELYGKKSADNLTIQELTDLQRRASSYGRSIEQSLARPSTVTDNAYFNVQRDASQLFDGAIPAGARSTSADLVPASARETFERLMSGATDTPRLTGDTVIPGAGRPRTEAPRNVVDADNAIPAIDRILEQLQRGGDFVADAGGQSRVGEWASKRNPFSTRSFRSTDPFVNEMAVHSRLAQTLQFGRNRQAVAEIDKIKRIAKGLTEAERKMIPYVLEKHFPGNVSADVAMKGMNRAKIEEAASVARNMLDRLGQQGVDAGTIRMLRQDYFPHIINRGTITREELLQKYADDPELLGLLGQSATARAGKQRKSFHTLANLDNYMVKLSKQLESLAPDSDDYMRIAQKLDDLSNLFERDPIKALGKYVYDTNRAAAMRQLYDTFEENGMLWRKSSGQEIHPTQAGLFHKLEADEARALGLEPGDRLHEEIYQGMQKLQELFTVRGMNKFMTVFDVASSILKTFQTTYIPVHYYNNFIGNIANNSMAGVMPKHYVQAGNYLKKIRTGNVTADEQKVIQQMFDNGVIGRGWSSDVFSDFERTTAEKVAEKISSWKYPQLLRSLGDSSDNFTRMALFLKGMEQTGNTQKAGEMVRKYLFNYNELSNADRVVRSFVPYWNWTKNNIPLQIDQFLKQPRYAMTYERIREELMGGEENKDSMYQWQREGYLPIPGTGKMMPARPFPVNDLTQLDNPLDSAINMLNPWLKAPAEISLNKKFFNKQPLEYGIKPDENPSAESIFRHLLSQTGFAGRVVNTLEGKTQPLDWFIGKWLDQP